MACRLCLNAKPLQKSHIVPEFVYEPLYNAKHQLSAQAGSTRVKIFQKEFGKNYCVGIVTSTFRVTSAMLPERCSAPATRILRVGRLRYFRD